ncbi:MAG: ABC transporter substrate-binding protein [Aliidongia sp.]
MLLPFIAGGLLLTGTPAAAASAPAPIRIGMPYDPSSLDPDKLVGFEEYNIVLDLFEGLTTYSATGTVIAGAAERWEVSADGLVWTFHLRPSAAWSDGTPLTADDFVYGFHRAVDPATACPVSLPCCRSSMPARSARAVRRTCPSSA